MLIYHFFLSAIQTISRNCSSRKLSIQFLGTQLRVWLFPSLPTNFLIVARWWWNCRLGQFLNLSPTDHKETEIVSVEEAETVRLLYDTSVFKKDHDWPKVRKPNSYVQQTAGLKHQIYNVNFYEKYFQIQFKVPSPKCLTSAAHSISSSPSTYIQKLGFFSSEKNLCPLPSPASFNSYDSN